jgi:DNA-binding transcriptional LysR family regulator
MSRPSLNDLTAFVAIATHRNFRRAADELGAAPSTLSHTMRALEARLGVRLLNRTTRSVSPTEAGLQLLARLKPALGSLDDALESVAGFRGEVTGAVRINAPRVAAALIVKEVLPLMSARHPEVSVDIVVEGALIDIVADGFDAGVRLMESVPRDMIAVPLTRPLRFVCVASPAYLDGAGAPGTPEELKAHRCIGHRLPSGRLYRWDFERSGQALSVDVAGSVVLDDEDLMVDAAVQGLGVAYVVEAAATAALAAGQVVEVLTPWLQGTEAAAVYYSGHRAVPLALRAFLDIVREVGKTDDHRW